MDDEGGKPSLLQRLFNRKKRLEYAVVSQSELLERFKKSLVLAVDLAVFQGKKIFQNCYVYVDKMRYGSQYIFL